MARERFANNFSTTLSSNVAIGDGTINVGVAAPTELQQVGQFRILIDTEVLLVTGGANTTTWTVSRGQEGTAAAAHTSPAAVIHLLTADAIKNAITPQRVPTTLAANGGVTLDAQSAETQAITLQANATSCTINNPINGQRLTLRWIQDATGGRTYTWPASWVFADGATPAPVTAPNAYQSSTAIWDSTAGKWNEISRSPAALGTAAYAAIDTVAGDFQMNGAAAAGSTGKVADAGHVHPTDTSRAPVASPTLTGTPAAPTAAVDTSTTQIATTAFVLGQTSATNPTMNGAASPGTSARYARADHVHPVFSGTTIVTASNAAQAIPAGAGVLRLTLVAGGAGGSGGGANSAAAAQAGGAGGGAGGAVQVIVNVGTNTTLNVTIGAGGGGGTGGAAGSSAGGRGTAGGTTSVVGNTTGINVSVPGGSGGAPPAASSTTTIGGGIMGQGTNNMVGAPAVGAQPGQGGANGASANGFGGAPGSLYSGGGGGGGSSATTTNGGAGGGAGSQTAGGTPGSGGAASGTAGGTGNSAAANTGAGGGGGGGGTGGTGAGGAGGAGGSGYMIMEVIG